MGNRAKKPLSQLGVMALAAAALVAATTQFSSTPVRAQAPSTDETGGTSRATDAIFRIFVRHNLFITDREKFSYFSTGVLVREPNIILTTHLTDEFGLGIFEEVKRVQDRLAELGLRGPNFACVEQQKPDIVELEARARERAVNATAAKESGDVVFREIAKKTDTTTSEKGKKKSDGEKEAMKAFEEQKKSLQEQGEYCIRFRVRKIDRERKLVLLEAEEKLDGNVMPFNVTNTRVGTELKAYGFPVNVERMVARRSTEDERKVARLVPTITAGKVVKTNVSEKEGQVIVHQIPLSDQHYGGPLINECGQVVGLNVQPKDQVRLVTLQGSSTIASNNNGVVKVGRISVPASVTEARGAKELRTFLQLNGIELTGDRYIESPCVVQAGFAFTQNNWMLFIVLATLLLASAALVISLRRPGPVRDTVARVFPGIGHSRTTPQGGELFDEGYGQDYRHSLPADGAGAYGQHGSGRPQIETVTSTPPTHVQSGAAATELMPASGGNVTLVPTGGGSAISLDHAGMTAGGLTVGRESSCSVVLDNTTISKHHARLSLAGGNKLVVEDLGSANGTWSNGRRIQREQFANGAVVRFGSAEFRVEMPKETGPGADSTLVMQPPKRWLLSGFDGDGQVVRWQLEPDEDSSGRQVQTSWVIGRNSDRAALVLTDKSVSGEHARIRFTPQRGLEICDVGSANGTVVNGSEVQDSYVTVDDVSKIKLGTIELTLSVSYL